MQRIIGIDPGLRYSGWGIIDKDHHHVKYVASGRIAASEQKPLAERLLTLYLTLTEILESLQPDIAAMEETFINKNPTSSLKLGHARGALMLTLSMHQLPIYEYSATKIKKTITGVGRADKDQISMMVKQLLPQVNLQSYDEADALATALCHSQHQEILQ